MDEENEELTAEFFQKLIADSDPDVIIDHIQVTAGSGRGDNYTSQLYRVRAEGHSSCRLKWSKSFICKILPANRARREAFKSEALFKNEVIFGGLKREAVVFGFIYLEHNMLIQVAFYTHALPALLKFQSERGVQVFKETPKVYLAKPTIIILEDLKEKGYEMIDRKMALDLKHCQALLKTLGRLHGLSIALKMADPSVFSEEVTDRIKECLFRPENEEWYADYYQKAGQNAMRMMKETLEEAPSRTKYLEQFAKFMCKGFFKRMVEKVNTAGPLAVLCHGDCWTNNFLFRYDSSGNISSLRMVDFQFARYASPALDLVYLLFNCTNQDVRSLRLDLLVETYCSSLTTTLALLSVPKDVLGFGNICHLIKEEMNRLGSVGLGLAIEMIPICTCESEQAPDLYELSQTEDGGNAVQNRDTVVPNSEACRVRMTELVVELIDKEII